MKNFNLLTTIKRTLTLKRNFFVSASRVLCFMVLFTSNTKAQDDPNCGFVVDGILVDSITSWSIGELKVVFPVLQSWSKFDFVEGLVYFDGTTTSRSNFEGRSTKRAKYFFRLKPEDLSEYANGKYAVYTIIKKDGEDRKNDVAKDGYCNNCKSGGDYNTLPVDADDKPLKPVIFIELRGYTITGYGAEYSNGTAIKVPLYDGTADIHQGNGTVNREAIHGRGEVLYTSKSIPYKLCFCTYDKKTYKNLQYLDACNECKIDFSKQAVQPGKKYPLRIEAVGFKGEFGKVLQGKSSNSSTKTEVKTNTTTETKTTVTKTTTTKTSTSSGALTSSALKPLDKSKAGYFVEKDGGQITQEGYKKGDARNGEVRAYDEGKLRSVTTYVNDEKNGAAALYYTNGNLEESGNYKADNKDGEWKRYTEAGKLAGTDIYVDGEKQ